MNLNNRLSACRSTSWISSFGGSIFLNRIASCWHTWIGPKSLSWRRHQIRSMGWSRRFLGSWSGL